MDCQLTGDECIIINPYDAGYQYWPNDVNEVTRFYEVTVVDPNPNARDPLGDGFEHIERTKRVHVKWIRNDYPVVDQGLEFDGVVQDLSATGLTIDMGTGTDKLMEVIYIDPENEND